MGDTVGLKRIIFPDKQKFIVYMFDMAEQTTYGSTKVKYVAGICNGSSICMTLEMFAGLRGNTPENVRIESARGLKADIRAAYFEYGRANSTLVQTQALTAIAKAKNQKEKFPILKQEYDKDAREVSLAASKLIQLCKTDEEFAKFVGLVK